jgi:hypothetical protein
MAQVNEELDDNRVLGPLYREGLKNGDDYWKRRMADPPTGETAMMQLMAIVVEAHTNRPSAREDALWEGMFKAQAEGCEEDLLDTVVLFPELAELGALVHRRARVIGFNESLRKHLRQAIAEKLGPLPGPLDGEIETMQRWDLETLLVALEESRTYGELDSRFQEIAAELNKRASRFGMKLRPTAEPAQSDIRNAAPITDAIQ